jgi:hypothetical protein
MKSVGSVTLVVEEWLTRLELFSAVRSAFFEDFVFKGRTVIVARPPTLLLFCLTPVGAVAGANVRFLPAVAVTALQAVQSLSGWRT